MIRLTVDEAREWQIAFELRPQPQREDEVTAFATRTNKRLQDLPIRVEVLRRRIEITALVGSIPDQP